MILLSAGHYPQEPGACFGEFCEHPEASIWCENILKEFDYLDLDAALVPTGTLSEKVKFINSKNAVAVIEVHFNSAMHNGKHVGVGCETLYCPGSNKGEILAKSIHKYVVSLFAPDRGVKEGWYKMDKPGHVDYPGDIEGDEKPDYFLKYTNCPAIILEPEFIQNKELIVKRRETGAKNITYGIIEGIERF